MDITDSYTLEAVVDAASTVIAKFPHKRNKVDLTQGSCSYVDALSNPSCFVGHIMSELDAALPNYNDNENFGALQSIWPFTPEAAIWLHHVQASADGDPECYEDILKGECPMWGSLGGWIESC